MGVFSSASTAPTLVLPEWLRWLVGAHRGRRGEGPASIRFMVAYIERLRIQIAMAA